MTESTTSVYNTNHLVLVARKIIGVRCENQAKYKNILCLKNTEVSYVAADGTYVYLWVLSCFRTKIFPNLHINYVGFNIWSSRNLMTLLRFLV